MKRIIDILMIITFTLLMCFSHTGLYVHRVLGIIFIILFLIHNLLNINYYKILFKGKYNKRRIFMIIIDSLLLLMALMMIISVILIINNYMIEIGRILYIISSYSMYMLCGMHIGIHFNNKKEIINYVLIIFGILFGINGFIKRKIISKLLLRSMFPVYYDESILISIIDYLGILILFGTIAKLINRKKRKVDE